MKRGSGVLLHISSLPSRYGIGDFGPAGYRFIDFLRQAGQRYWQVLPFNPTDTVYGSSPYSSPSAFAINALFIDPDDLVRRGWLKRNDLAKTPAFSKDQVNYDTVTAFKNRLFSQAFQRFKGQASRDQVYQRFCAEQAFWIEDYALFVVLKQHFSGQPWDQWPMEIRRRDRTALDKLCHRFQEELEEICFRQYLAFQQSAALRSYCRQKDIRLIGDIPIYVNFDSADVWAHPEIFKLDEHSRPMYVAGVPPDYFSETGQRWGNPVYDWERLKEGEYDWWLGRVRHNLSLFDYIRIDHFRGLIGYWQIPAQEETAVNGEWIPGPGDDFFNALKSAFPRLPIIAEDLGIITPDVTEAMQKFRFPGMKVLLFAFGGDLETHPYIPENYTSPCIVYTGTHDNNTVKGWLAHDASPEEKKNLYAYLGKKVSKDNLPWELIRLAMASTADVAIIPMQDILGLGAEARMNVPATAQGNWQWRLEPRALTSRLSGKLARIAKSSNRI